jgi:hypothetical protein
MHGVHSQPFQQLHWSELRENAGHQAIIRQRWRHGYLLEHGGHRVPASGVCFLGRGKRIGVMLCLLGFQALHDEQQEVTDTIEEPPARRQGHDDRKQLPGASRVQTQPSCELRVGCHKPTDEGFSGPQKALS